MPARPCAPNVVLSSGYTDDERTSLAASGAATFADTFGYDQYGNLTSEQSKGVKQSKGVRSH